jgi:CRISPR/Cas system-associated protein endoribonuclease Cas2
MIYKTLDTIPAKIYYKIIETGDISLLSTTETTVEKLEEIWERIKSEDESFNNDQNRRVKTFSKIESLQAKLESIQHAVFYLKIEDDAELRELLKSYGYTYHSHDDLDRILLQSDGINDAIDKLRLKLPKENISKSAIPFDEMVLSAGVIAGVGFIDTNTITKTQLDGILKITETKIKASGKGK